MPQIIVTADRSTDRGEGAVMLRERINVADFESDHFAAQLVERLGWAVNDAHDVEQEAVPPANGKSSSQTRPAAPAPEVAAPVSTGSQPASR